MNQDEGDTDLPHMGWPACQDIWDGLLAKTYGMACLPRHMGWPVCQDIWDGLFAKTTGEQKKNYLS